MSIPIQILFQQPTILVPHPFQTSTQKALKIIAKPLDADCFFQSVRELEDYIKNDTTAFVGQVVVVDRDVYTITEIGEKPRYHKLQTEQSKIIIDEYGCICDIKD